jgi:hypothetical protein
MSASLAAAKKRRAPVQAGPATSPAQQTAGSSSPAATASGLTLPQVIQVVDRRLFMLENTVKEMVSNRETTNATSNEGIPSNITEVLDDFNQRFEDLATEVASIKNIVISLQAYTMDVNKMLLEDRVELISGNKHAASLEQELSR